MASFKATFSEQGNMTATFTQNEDMQAAFGVSERIETSDYNALYNKPSIEGHTLVGDKTFKQLGMDTLAEWEIEKILYLD